MFFIQDDVQSINNSVLLFQSPDQGGFQGASSNCFVF